MEYSHDAHQRVTQVRRKPLGGAEETCQQVNYTHDTPPDGSFTYTFSRLATVTWGGASCTGNYSWAEWYSYTQGGLVLKKRLRAGRTGDVQRVSGFPQQGSNPINDLPMSQRWRSPITTGGYGYDPKGT